jgi:S1-C subfamily serine protease
MLVGPDGTGTGSDTVIVQRVVAASPACKAGIREGDVIKRVDGVSPCAVNTLSAMITAKKPGAVVNLELSRGGKRVNVKVTLGARDVPVFKFKPIERTPA